MQKNQGVPTSIDLPSQSQAFRDEGPAIALLLCIGNTSGPSYLNHLVSISRQAEKHRHGVIDRCALTEVIRAGKYDAFIRASQRTT